MKLNNLIQHFVALLLFSCISKADFKVALFPVNYDQHYLTNSNKEYIWKDFNTIAASITMDNIELLIENSRYESTSGNSVANITERISLNSISSLYKLLNLGSLFDLKLGFGIGKYQLTTTSQLYSISAEDKTDDYFFSPMLSAQMIYSFLKLQTDIKINWIKDLDPQPHLEILFRLGVEF